MFVAAVPFHQVRILVHDNIDMSAYVYSPAMNSDLPDISVTPKPLSTIHCQLKISSIYFWPWNAYLSRARILLEKMYVNYFISSRFVTGLQFALVALILIYCDI